MHQLKVSIQSQPYLKCLRVCKRCYGNVSVGRNRPVSSSVGIEFDDVLDFREQNRGRNAKPRYISGKNAITVNIKGSLNGP